MTFLYPYVLYALVVPVALAIIAWGVSARRSHRWEILVSQNYQDTLVQKPNRWLRQLSVVSGILSLAFLIFALARPISGFKESATMQRGHNILLAIDCSRSMQAKDVTPSRLDLAKTAAYDLLEAMPEDNFGLIIFSGEAQLLIPLTHDHSAVRESIEQLEYGWVSLGGTDLQNVMKLALNTFKRDHADSTNALIILSDGEDTVNVNYETALQAKENHLIVVTAGIGTEEGDMMPDPRQQDGFYRDRQGRHVITKLDSTALRALAKETGGQYIQIGPGSDLTQVVKNVAQHLDEEEAKGDIQRVPEDKYAIFAFLALVFLLSSLILGTRWRSFRSLARLSSTSKHTNLTILVLALILTISGHAAQAVDLPRAPQAVVPRQASSQDSANLKEKYQTVLEKVTPSVDSSSGGSEKSATLSYLKGYLQHLDKNNEAATASYSAALLAENTTLQAATHYNIGNTVADKAFAILNQSSVANNSAEQQPRISPEKIEEAKVLIKQAISHYDDALNTTPDLEQAKVNKERLEQFLKDLEKEEEEQKQQQEQNDQNQDSQQDKDDSSSSLDSSDKNQDQSDQNNSSESKNQDKNTQGNDKKQNKDQSQGKQGQDKDKSKDSSDSQQDQNQDKQDDKKDSSDKDSKSAPQDRQKGDQQDKQDTGSQDKPEDGSKSDTSQQPSSPNSPQQDKNSDKGNGDQKQAPPLDLNANPDKESTSQQQQSSEQANQQMQEAEVAESQEDKEKREAIQMLRERADLEKGSPIQQRAYPYVPDKDY